MLYRKWFRIGNKLSKAKLSKQKLRGGYYTPDNIVNFLNLWAIRSKTSKLLEPSCGDGIFLESAYFRFKELGATKNIALANIHAIELDSFEYRKAKEKLKSFAGPKQKLWIKNADFFSLIKKNPKFGKFDSIVGNPPFIRYQNFDEGIQKIAIEMVKEFGVNISKLANIWMPFLVISTMLLEKNGRLAMILPAELLQVKYASELRVFLSKFFDSITIITFKKLVFPGIQQEIILFLGEKNSKKKGIKVIELNNVTELNKKCLMQIKTQSKIKPINHIKDKWIQYFLNKKEILLLRKLKNDKRLTKFSTLAEVDVGVVTGRNEFFVIDKEKVVKNHLTNYVVPIVSRSIQLNGAIFIKNEWKQNNEDGHNCNLLYFNGKPFSSLNKNAQKYITEGEKKEFDKGYKCRIRYPWYKVPSVWVPDAFMFRQIYLGPRLVLNKSDSTVTDTIHRVKFRDKTDGNSLIVSFHNSLTFAFSEIMGRSYGGGVLELEPNEAEELPIPYFPFNKKILVSIDNKLRQKKTIEEILDFTDQLVLKEKLGLSSTEIITLRTIWKKLSSRRIFRKFDKISPTLPKKISPISMS